MNSVDFSVVILAAGAANRFGSPKQLAKIGGEAMLELVIRKAISLNKPVYVTLGAYQGEIRSNIDFGRSGVTGVTVPNWHLGQSASVHAGVRQVLSDSPEAAGILILLADQPLLLKEDMERLLAEIQISPDEPVSACYDGRAGVPAYFPRSYFEALLSLEGDQGARAVLRKNNPKLLEFDGRLIDVDRPEDLSGF